MNRQQYEEYSVPGIVCYTYEQSDVSKAAYFLLQSSGVFLPLLPCLLGLIC